MSRYTVGFYMGLHYSKVKSDTLEDAYRVFRDLVDDGLVSPVNLWDSEGAATVVGWDRENGEMFSPVHPDAERIRQMGRTS